MAEFDMISRQRRLADALLQQALAPAAAPINNPWEGIARALGAAASGYFSHRADERADTLTKKRNVRLADALAGVDKARLRPGGPTVENAAALEAAQAQAAEIGRMLDDEALPADAARERLFDRRFPKPKDPIKTSAGDSLVDPDTFRTLYTAPEKAKNPIRVGNQLVDPDTFKPVYTGPTTPRQPRTVETDAGVFFVDIDENGRPVLGKRVGGTPQRLPSGMVANPSDPTAPPTVLPGGPLDPAAIRERAQAGAEGRATGTPAKPKDNLLTLGDGIWNIEKKDWEKKPSDKFTHLKTVQGGVWNAQTGGWDVEPPATFTHLKPVAGGLWDAKNKVWEQPAKDDMQEVSGGLYNKTRGKWEIDPPDKQFYIQVQGGIQDSRKPGEWVIKPKSLQTIKDEATARSEGTVLGRGPRTETRREGEKIVTYKVYPGGREEKISEGSAWRPQRPPEREQKIKDLESRGMSHDDAVDVVDGHVAIIPDQQYGGFILRNKATGQNKYVPTTSMPMEGSRPATGGAGVMPDNVDYSQGTGVSGFAGSIVNKLSDLVDAPLAAPETERAISGLNNLKVRTQAMLESTIPGRPSNMQLQLLGELAVEPGKLLQGDRRARERLGSTRDMIKGELDRMQRDIFDRPGLFKRDTLSEYELNRSQLQSVLNDYNTVITSFDRAFAAEKGGAPSPVDSLVDKYRTKK